MEQIVDTFRIFFGLCAFAGNIIRYFTFSEDALPADFEEVRNPLGWYPDDEEESD